jgi:hypothetical protein
VTEEPEVQGPEDERQQLNHVIDRLRLYASQAQEIAAGNASADLLVGGEIQMLTDDLINAANWLDTMVMQMEDAVPDSM